MSEPPTPETAPPLPGPSAPRRSTTRAPGVLRRSARGLRNLMPDRLLFNPVFWKDSAISARKKGTFAFRGFYMLLVLLAVAIAAIPLAGSLEYAGPAERLQSGAVFAGTLAQVIQWTQLLALMVAGPILASGAIAQEKTNRSLDSLYATPLTRAQIVWGKLSARLVQIVLLALMPLPILLMLRALGGIDTMVTLQQTALILGAAVLTTSMGLFASVHSKKPWAVVGSVAVIIGLLHLIGPVMAFRMQAGMATPIWLVTLSFCIAPVFPFIGISFPGALSTLGAVVPVHPGMLFGVAIALQLGMAAGITSAAALLLRRIERPRGRINTAEPPAVPASPPVPASPATPASPEESAPPQALERPKRRRARTPRGSRVVADWPVLWRELRQPTIDLGRWSWLRWILFPAIGIAIAGLFFVQLPDGQRPYQEAFSYIILFSSIGFYLIIVSMTRTTPLIPQERSARTWDVLRTTPMGPLTIVVQKYFGSMAKPWLLGGLLLLAMLPAVMLGLLHWSVLPFLAVSLAMATAFLGATGLLLGTMLRKGLAATGANLGVALGLWMLLPIAVGVVNDGFDQGQTAVLWFNPFVQAGISFEGCYELSPRELRLYDNNPGADWFHTGYPAFGWPSEELTLFQHAGMVASSAIAYVLAIVGCLWLAAWRLEKLRPNA